MTANIGEHGVYLVTDFVCCLFSVRLGFECRPLALCTLGLQKLLRRLLAGVWVCLTTLHCTITSNIITTITTAITTNTMPPLTFLYFAFPGPALAAAKQYPRRFVKGGPAAWQRVGERRARGGRTGGSVTPLSCVRVESVHTARRELGEYSPRTHLWCTRAQAQA